MLGTHLRGQPEKIRGDQVVNSVYRHAEAEGVKLFQVLLLVASGPSLLSCMVCCGACGLGPLAKPEPPVKFKLSPGSRD